MYNYNKTIQNLVKSVHTDFPDKSNIEKSKKIVGRSYSWFLKMSHDMGIIPNRNRRPKENFFSQLDKIPLKGAKIIKGYALGTVRSYCSEYCSGSNPRLKYQLTETKTGVSVKLLPFRKKGK